MSGELAFVTPKAILKGFLRIYVGGTVVGTVIYVLIGPPTSLSVIVGVLLICAVTLGVLFAAGTKRQIAFLSAEGIRGLDASGGMTLVRWSDPIKIERAQYFYWPGLRMEKEDGSHIVLPLALLTSPDFREALKRCASSDHALPKALKRWGSG